MIEVKKHEEGFENKPYKDHLGYWTIGVGHLIDPRKGGSLPEWAKEELDRLGYLTDPSIDRLLNMDIDKVLEDFRRHLPWVFDLDEVRFGVLVDMCFQMGIGNEEAGTGLLGFKNTLAHVRAGRYIQAAENMQQSLWYRQTPNRANRRIKEMITGEYNKYV